VTRVRLLAAFAILLLSLPVVATLPVFSAPGPAVAPGAPIHGFKVKGPAPSDLQILVTLAIPLRNVNVLHSLVTQISDPGSPMFRHFLTPEEVKAEFLPTADFNTMVAFLQTNGLRVETTALDSFIVVGGSVAQFQSALGTGVNTYTNGTRTYYASSSPVTFQGAYVYASNASFIFTRPLVGAQANPRYNVTFTQGSFSAKQLQPVYNATSLYAHGYNGTGKTIGILDFFGSPTIANDLKLFDQTFGFPDTKLTIIPVGPYDPNLGVNQGWSTEISLDVETSHAMAPGAAIDLYVANGALPLSVPIAQIVQDDKVTTLSQSFGNFEWFYSLSYYLGGPSFFTFNSVIPDQLYALGSVEGISFLASSGDAGGSGYSSGPEGNLEYPATSPFVTSVGGTQTYFSSTSTGGTRFAQTAWSNIGFVPNLVNEGGGGGGVSILEPKPWYQLKQPTPPSYPNGRLNPDLSLQAGIDPATLIVDGGSIIGTGGTSESSPLLAGLLTLVAQSAGGNLGLVNPFLYGVGNDQTKYTKGFTPITFGYIVPWTASFGFNLATGWGAPNIGGLAALMKAGSAQHRLTIRGGLFNSTGGSMLGYTQGQKLTVQAKIRDGAARVTSGTFTLSIQSLTGSTSPAAMSYNPGTGNWSATVSIGRQSGISYSYVTGTSTGGATGDAIGVFFAGYVGSLTATGWIYSLPIDPWTWSPSSPLGLTVFVSDLKGNPAPAGPVVMSVQPYNIGSNTYSTAGSLSLLGAGTGSVTGALGVIVPDGPVSLVLTGGFYGYAPTVRGIYLQSSYIYPSVAAEPGSVSPGQALTIISYPIAPVNVYFSISFETGRQFAFDVLSGSNVTASLIDPSGRTVSTAQLYYQSCAQALRVCSGGAQVIYGQLPVPSSATPGLYTVTLSASYGSYTPGGNVTGRFYSQVWVSGPSIKPVISLGHGFIAANAAADVPQSPGGLYMGEKAHVVARLSYANGSAVKYGMFSAVVYPASLASSYTSLMHRAYAGGQLIRLTYDPALQAWLGNATLPGPAGQGVLGALGITSFDYSGPYDVYVTGLSSDGTPTTTEISAQQSFYVQPFAYVDGGTLSSAAGGSRQAFSGVTITASGTISGDVFVGTNTVSGGTLTISGSQIQGTLVVKNATVTLVGVSGGNINATGSTLVLKDSGVGALSLVGSKVTLQDASYQSVSPALPTISAQGLSLPISGVGKYNITVAGQEVVAGSLRAAIDGAATILTLNPTSSTTLVGTGKIDAGALPDGVHTLAVTVSQSDGLSTTFTTSFSTNARQAAQAFQLLLVAAVLAFVAAASAVALYLGLQGRKRARLGQV
jgi:subtilase family serine protease